MNKITAPFTADEVKALNEYQQRVDVHPFTCCSAPGCLNTGVIGERTLLATIEGWVCPCGKYTQDWAHLFMVLPSLFSQRNNSL